MPFSDSAYLTVSFQACFRPHIRGGEAKMCYICYYATHRDPPRVAHPWRESSRLYPCSYFTH